MTHWFSTAWTRRGSGGVFRLSFTVGSASHFGVAQARCSMSCDAADAAYGFTHPLAGRHWTFVGGCFSMAFAWTASLTASGIAGSWPAADFHGCRRSIRPPLASICTWTIPKACGWRDRSTVFVCASSVRAMSAGQREFWRQSGMRAIQEDRSGEAHLGVWGLPQRAQRTQRFRVDLLCVPCGLCG